jgi:hypothetical protein
LTSIRVEGLGLRRGPPAEARSLYQALDADIAGLTSDLDPTPRH